MKIPNDIKTKIESEGNWRSTNGHGGVDETTLNNFILAATWGYELAYIEILKSKGQLIEEKIEQRCICGHLHSEHHPINSHNYSAGRCTIGECRCNHFLHEPNP